MNPYSSALDLARAIRAREISPLELVKFYLDRVDRINPELNAIIWRRDEQLLAEAEAATEAVMKNGDLPPFFGVPIPVKDLTDVEGWPTTLGSRAAANRLGIGDAEVVAQLRKAGFLLMCRTNTPEFGTVSVTENQAYGATRNPWNRLRTPGGSSGGAAAAVAAGMAPVAHANDGGGSIRIPAACCGLVGLKPSRGRTCSGPPWINDAMHGFAVEGCVSHTVADTAAVLDAIAVFDPLAWYNAPEPERPFLEEVGADPGRLRVAFTTRSPTGGKVDRECVNAVELTARMLEEAGHEVFESELDWPDGDTMTAAFIVIWNTGVVYWDVNDWSKVEPLNRAMLEAARRTSSADYVQALAATQMFSRRIVASWSRDFDILLTPTTATEPPEVGVLWEGSAEDPLRPLMTAAELVPFTPWFNVTGQPAVSLPIHHSASGLPVGVQLVGAPWGEAQLLRVAAQLEERTNWRQRSPDL
ncbi:MAG: amidase [Candidatus Binatia bacterium]